MIKKYVNKEKTVPGHRYFQALIDELEHRRNHQGWNQKEMAEQLGITPNSYSKFINLETHHPELVFKVCKYLGVVVKITFDKLGKKDKAYLNGFTRWD